MFQKYSNEYNSKQINPNIDTIDIEENNFNTNPHLQLPTDNRSVNLTPLDSQHLTDAQAQLNIINKNNLLSNSKQTNKQAHTSCKKTSEGKLAATSVSKSVGGKMARSKKTKGRVKIKMEFIENKIRRYTTFSKRKTGIMKKVSLFHDRSFINTNVMSDNLLNGSANYIRVIFMMYWSIYIERIIKKFYLLYITGGA